MASTFPNGYAVLIGIDENSIPTRALPDVAKDVAAVHKVLADPNQCAYEADNIHPLTGDKATRANILAELAWLKEKLAKDESGNATAVVYYTGHGHKDASGHYLVPFDATSNIRSSGLRADDFAAAIDDMNPMRLLVLLDCCFAGGIGAKELDAPGNLNPAPIPVSPFLGGVSHGHDALRQAVAPTGAKGDPGPDLLARGAGRVVMSASQANQVSWIRKDGAMSVFTYHLIEALTGHAGTMPLGKQAQGVGVLNAMLHVSVKVPETVHKERGATEDQVPDFWFTGQNFPIALVHGGKGATKGLDLMDPLAIVAAAPEPPKASVIQSVKNGKKVAQVVGQNNQVNIS